MTLICQHGYYSYMMDSDGSKIVAAYVTLANKPGASVILFMALFLCRMAL